MPMRHRPMLLAAVASVLLASGCLNPTSLPPGMSTDETRINGGTDSKKLESSSLRGTIVVPPSIGKKPSNLSVQAVNQSLRRYPNSSAATSDASGAFRLSSLPSNAVMLVTTEVGGVTLAAMGMPIPKKDGEASVTLTYASTVAVGGVLTLFTETEEHSAFLPDDIPLNLFANLVKAVGDAPADVALNQDLRTLAEPFDALKAKNAPVKAAFDALLAKCKENLKARLERGTTPGGATNPDPLTSSSPGGATPDPNATATPNPQGTATPQPDGTLPDPYAPIIGRFDQVGTDSYYVPGDTQMLAMTDPNFNKSFLLIPNGNSIVQVSPDDAVKSFSLGDGVTAVQTLALNMDVGGDLGGGLGGTYKAHSIGLVEDAGGNKVLSLITVDLVKMYQNSPSAVTSLPLTGLSAQGVTALIYDARTKMLYAASPTEHKVVKIDPSTAEVMSFAGGAPGGEPTMTKTAAADFSFNAPSGLALDIGGALYVSDRDNNRIVRITLTDGMAEPVTGSKVLTSLLNGKLSEAGFEKPNSLGYDATNSVLYVSDYNHGTLRAVDIAKNKVVSYATTSTAGAKGLNAVDYPRAVVKMDGVSGKVYVLDKYGKLYKFTPN